MARGDFRVLLVRPSLGGGRPGGYRTPALMEPLSLAILKALTPPEIHVHACDERLEPVPLDQHWDLAALSLCSFSARRGYQLADALRAKGVPVVLGGFHPTLMPDEAAAHADAIACGDAEACWPQVLADAQQHTLAKVYRAPAPGPSQPVIPDRSIFVGKRYLPLGLVQFGRGCPRRCEFCSVRAFYADRVVHRAVDDVIAEIRQNRFRRVFFVDDNFLGNRARVHELMEALVGLGVKWSCQADIGFADDPELLALAVRSGCQSVTIGFETLNSANLGQMGKAWNKTTSYSERLARLRQAGVMVYGTFIFGYDADDVTSFAPALEFAIKEKLFLANFNPLQPLPGTALYERLSREQRLARPAWWLDPGYRWHDALVTPKQMSAAELTQGCRWAREQFHSIPSMVRRLVDRGANFRNPGNALTFLVANLVSRADIKAKTRLTPAQD